MINRFIEYILVEKHYSVKTADAYRHDLEALCAFLEVDVEDFDPLITTEDDIKAFLIDLLDKGGSPRSACRYLSSLRSFWKFLLRIGYVKVDITARVVAPKTDKPLPVFFKENEVEKATAREDKDDDFVSVRDTLIIEIFYQTGMRRAEMLGLKLSSIDEFRKVLKVLGKRNKERLIPISEELLTMINSYLDYRSQLPQLNEGELFITETGKPLTNSRLYNIVRSRMGEVSTLKKHSPHVLRHTFATTMLDNGADINTIKTLMGHASLAATQIYTHTTFEQIRQEYNKSHPRAKGKD